MSKHIPGPWEEGLNSEMKRQITDKKHNIICVLPGDYQVNAELIAAAPEMYAAIEKFLIAREEEDMYHMEEAVDDMREALEKAEGK